MQTDNKNNYFWLLKYSDKLLPISYTSNTYLVNFEKYKEQYLQVYGDSNDSLILSDLLSKIIKFYEFQLSNFPTFQILQISRVKTNLQLENAEENYYRNKFTEYSFCDVNTQYREGINELVNFYYNYDKLWGKVC